MLQINKENIIDIDSEKGKKIISASLVDVNEVIESIDNIDINEFSDEDNTLDYENDSDFFNEHVLFVGVKKWNQQLKKLLIELIKMVELN